METIFTDHFGRTPLNTPYGTQELQCDDTDSGDDTDDEDDTLPLTIDERARQYIDRAEQLQDDGRNDQSEDSDSSVQSEGAESIILSPDDPDVQKIHQLKLNGCGCKNNCPDKFSEIVIYKHILNINEMEKTEKEMYIMATFVEKTEETKRGKKRKRVRHDFQFLGNKVCRKMFMLAFAIGKHSLQNIMTHVSQHGAVPRSHGNTNRTPVHALTFDDTKAVVQYISNFADEFGMPQPAAPRGRDNTPPIYLTCETTKTDLHAKYVQTCNDGVETRRALKKSAFNNIWKQCLPHIRIATPRDDVCAICEKLRKAIMDAITETEKLETSEKMKDHIMSAQRERAVYNDCLKKSAVSRDDNSINRYCHYTFDFSQNMCLPHHARQMGPLYFTTLRKIQLFGIRIDGLPTQLNFLIDEDETIGKDGSSSHGPNAVISMLDWALEVYGNGELSCAFHADNCPGKS